MIYLSLVIFVDILLFWFFSYKGILVMISHSQDFMNGVCNSIMHMHLNKLKTYGVSRNLKDLDNNKLNKAALRLVEFISNECLNVKSVKKLQWMTFNGEMDWLAIMNFFAIQNKYFFHAEYISNS